MKMTIRRNRYSRTLRTRRYVGFGYGVIGIVVGTVFNPWGMATNLLGMVVPSVESIAVGLWNTAADLLVLMMLGWAQLFLHRLARQRLARQREVALRYQRWPMPWRGRTTVCATA